MSALIKEIVMKNINTAEKYGQVYIAPALDIDIIVLLLSFMFILSVNSVSSTIPKGTMESLTSPTVIFFITFLYTYRQSNSITRAVIIAGLVISVVMALRSSSSVEKFELIMPDTDTYLGCRNIKEKDILDMFEGDVEKANQAMYEIGVPGNLPLNDNNAPLIATYLINNNMNVNDSCKF
jgi:hypothetical protein